MFTNSAYEALYQYIGLSLHSRFVEVLTSHKVFLAMVLLIFGVMFFTTAVEFFSRYIPGALIKRRQVPLSKFVKIIFCLFIGMSLLKIGTKTGVKSFTGKSWHENSYVRGKTLDVKPEYQVSFIFDILSRTAEEVAGFLNRMVDDLFKTTNSNLEAPAFFYKAVLFAGSSTLADPNLREQVDYYTEECIEKVLPLLADDNQKNRFDSFFEKEPEIDRTLSQIELSDQGGQPGQTRQTCLDAKEEIRAKLFQEARTAGGEITPLFHPTSQSQDEFINDKTWQNIQVSSVLLDHYLEKKESFLGIQRGAVPPGGAAKAFQYLNRIFSWDAVSYLFGGRENHGASLAASRAQEFSENLTRAPHVAGFTKLCLIAFFPWLIFPVVAGYWRSLLFWFFLYLSVALWAPIWTLLYHIVTGITFSTETLSAFGKLSDGISLYSADVVNSRLNYMYAVYSWIQLLVATVITGGLLWFAKPLFSDGAKDSAPEFIDDAGRAASTGVSLGKFV